MKKNLAFAFFAFLVSLAAHAGPCTGVTMPGSWRVSGDGGAGEIVVGRESMMRDSRGATRPFRTVYVARGNPAFQETFGGFTHVGLISVTQGSYCFAEFHNPRDGRSLMLFIESVDGVSVLLGAYEEEVMVMSEYKNASRKFTFELLGR